MENLENIEKTMILVEADKGSELCQCLNEAAILALQEDCTVRLEFNEHYWELDPARIRGTLREVDQAGNQVEPTEKEP